MRRRYNRPTYLYFGVILKCITLSSYSKTSNESLARAIFSNSLMCIMSIYVMPSQGLDVRNDLFRTSTGPQGHYHMEDCSYNRKVIAGHPPFCSITGCSKRIGELIVSSDPVHCRTPMNHRWLGCLGMGRLALRSMLYFLRELYLGISILE